MLPDHGLGSHMSNKVHPRRHTPVSGESPDGGIGVRSKWLIGCQAQTKCFGESGLVFNPGLEI